MPTHDSLLNQIDDLIPNQLRVLADWCDDNGDDLLAAAYRWLAWSKRLPMFSGNKEMYFWFTGYSGDLFAPPLDRNRCWHPYYSDARSYYYETQAEAYGVAASALVAKFGLELLRWQEVVPQRPCYGNTGKT